MLSRDWPKPRLKPNPECQGCGRSIVTRFGGEAWGLCASCEDGVVAIDRQMAHDQQAWNARMRALGCKAAHPDDGWVDREKNKVHLCYPHFNDGLKVGDLLALGYPFSDTRIVRVTHSDDGGPFLRALRCLGEGPFYWHFEDVDALSRSQSPPALDEADAPATGQEREPEPFESPEHRRDYLRRICPPDGMSCGACPTTGCDGGAVRRAALDDR